MFPPHQACLLTVKPKVINKNTGPVCIQAMPLVFKHVAPYFSIGKGLKY